MKFNEHSVPDGAHAFLSPSKYHWINDDHAKIKDRYSKYRATIIGVELHEFASLAIKKKIKVARLKKALNMFINDAIGFNMESEQLLYYSEFAFGTTDAISFKNNLLRIHDLKTGVSKASFSQLCVYAAYFCLEYEYNPKDIDIELRIYQGNSYEVYKPTPEEIQAIMDKTVEFDKILRNIEPMY